VLYVLLVEVDLNGIDVRASGGSGRQQLLSEIAIEPIKNLGGLGKIWGPVPPDHNLEPPLVRASF